MHPVPFLSLDFCLVSLQFVVRIRTTGSGTCLRAWHSQMGPRSLAQCQTKKALGPKSETCTVILLSKWLHAWLQLHLDNDVLLQQHRP